MILNKSYSRAHKIIETSAGREYIPDTNSNNIVNLDAVYPQPNAYETKRGFMLRPVGKICAWLDINWSYKKSRNLSLKIFLSNALQ